MEVTSRHQALRTGTVFVESLDASSTFHQATLRNSRARRECLHATTSEAAIRAVSEAPRLPKDAHGPGHGAPAHSMVICSTDNDRMFCRLEISHLMSDDISTFDAASAPRLVPCL